MSNEAAHALDHLQRRNLQSCRSASGARTGRPSLHHPLATPKPSCTPTSNTGRIASTGSAACFASPSGTRIRRTLFCARDRLGNKPFYYYLGRPPVRLRVRNQGAAGASRHLAALRRGAATRDSRFRLLAAANDTLFRGIRKLMPGHYLTLDPAESAPQPKIARYWEVPSPGIREPRRPAPGSRNAAGAWKKRAHAPDERCAPRHVPVRGRRFQRHRRAHEAMSNSGPVKTFAVGYRGAALQRTGLCRGKLRATIGTEHHEAIVGHGRFLRRAAATDLA